MTQKQQILQLQNQVDHLKNVAISHGQRIAELEQRQIGARAKNAVERVRGYVARLHMPAVPKFKVVRA